MTVYAGGFKVRKPTTGSLTDSIVVAVEAGKESFIYNRTRWYMMADKNTLVGALDITLRQMDLGMYCGIHWKARIEKVRERLLAR